jgi:hypothetical protein
MIAPGARLVPSLSLVISLGSFARPLLVFSVRVVPTSCPQCSLHLYGAPSAATRCSNSAVIEGGRYLAQRFGASTPDDLNYWENVGSTLIGLSSSQRAGPQADFGPALARDSPAAQLSARFLAAARAALVRSL